MNNQKTFWITLTPAIFVVLWSSGFIGAKLGLPHAEPLTFLVIRFVLVILLILPFAISMKAPWPATPLETMHIAIAGLLVHGGYLAGVFCAIERGVPAGMVALVAGLQPILTAIAVGPLLGEHVSMRQWGGFALGLIGVIFVVWEKLVWNHSVSLEGMAFAIFALLSFTAGTLYQKRWSSHMDLRSGSIIQFFASLVMLAPLAWLFESMEISWTGEFVFALAWLVGVLSIGAISLLYVLIRRGEASKVSSLFYLTPPVTAFMAFALFGEKLGLPALAGMALTALGVALVVHNNSS